MPAPPKVTAIDARRAIARARAQLNQRNFSPGGDIYRDFAEPLDLLERFANEQEAEDGLLLNPAILKETATIWRTIEDQRAADEVQAVRLLKASVNVAASDAPRVYRATFKQLGAFEGSVKQLLELIPLVGAIIQNRENERLAAERRAERERQRAEPDIMPAVEMRETRAVDPADSRARSAVGETARVSDRP